MSASLAGGTEPVGLRPKQVALTEHIQNRKTQLLHWSVAQAVKTLFQLLTSRNVAHLKKKKKNILKFHTYTNIENVRIKDQFSVITSNRSIHLHKN